MLAELAATILGVGVVAFLVNLAGATGGHCDESCSGSFPYWLYAGSGYVVIVALGCLVAVGIVATVRRGRRRP